MSPRNDRRKERHAATVIRAFGLRLAELRSERGLSQEALAHEADLDRTYVSGIERGVRNPSLRNIAKLSSALDLPLATLFRDVPRGDG